MSLRQIKKRTHVSLRQNKTTGRVFVNGLTEITGTINMLQDGSHTGTCEPRKTGLSKTRYTIHDWIAQTII